MQTLTPDPDYAGVGSRNLRTALTPEAVQPSHLSGGNNVYFFGAPSRSFHRVKRDSLHWSHFCCSLLIKRKGFFDKPRQRGLVKR